MAHRRRGVGVGRTSGVSSISSSSSAHASVSVNASASTNTQAAAATTTSLLVQRKADEIKAISLQNAISTLELLEVKLTEFAQRHQSEIKNDPIFRHRFLQMCAPLGIDVLSSSKHKKTNIFQSLFSGLGSDSNSNHNSKSSSSSSSKNDYYYELAVKCAEVCLATQSRNGGIMSIQEIQSVLQNRKTKMGVTNVASQQLHRPNQSAQQQQQQQQQQATLEDIQIAIQQLSVLGGGFRTVQLPSTSSESTGSHTTTTMVISVPTELDNDHMQILSIAQQQQGSSSTTINNGITVDQLQTTTKWNNATRIQRALDLLLQEGMAWIDIHQGNTYYWFTSIWQQQQQQQQQQQ